MRTPQRGDIVKHWNGFYKIVSIHPREDSYPVHDPVYELEPLPEANIFRSATEFTVVVHTENLDADKDVSEDKRASDYLLSQTDHS